MYRENFKTELPQFSDRQGLISELGAVSGTFPMKQEDKMPKSSIMRSGSFQSMEVERWSFRQVSGHLRRSAY